MADLTLREFLTAAIKPLLPATWRFIPNQKTPEKVTVPTVVMKLLRLEPLPEAPRGAIRNVLVLTLITPIEEDVKAENALDDDVVAFLTALDGHKRIAWTDAQKVRDDQTNRLAWDFNVSAITTRPIEGA